MPPDVAFKGTLRWYFTCIVDAIPDVELERKLRIFSGWIVDARPDVAFEPMCCVEMIFLSFSTF